MDNHCATCGAYLADTSRTVCPECEATRPQANGNEDAKCRVLIVAKILNEGNLVSSVEILRRLDEEYGIKAEKRTIADDVSAINKIMPIFVKHGRNGGYKMKTEYPCDTCTKVQNPDKCENKLCKEWKAWFLKRWEALRNGR